MIIVIMIRRRLNKNEEEEEKGEEENERVRVKCGDFRFSQCCHAIINQLKTAEREERERENKRQKEGGRSFSLEKLKWMKARKRRDLMGYTFA